MSTSKDALIMEEIKRINGLLFEARLKAENDVSVKVELEKISNSTEYIIEILNEYT